MFRKLYTYQKKIYTFCILLAVFVYAIYVLLARPHDALGPLHLENLLKSSQKIGLTVQKITAKGLKKLTLDDLSHQLNVHKGAAILALDLPAMVTRLKQMTWVKNVKIHRNLSLCKLSIIIQEHEPLCLWENNHQWFLMSENGDALEAVDYTSLLPNLPKVRGTGAPQNLMDLRNILKSLPSIADQIAVSEFVGQRRWNLHLDNGVVILLPDTAVQKAIQRLTKLLSQRTNLLAETKVIDLRISDRITLEHKGKRNA